MSNEPEPLESFQRLQSEFTRHLRHPEHAPAPDGLEDRRVSIYRDLLYKNIESFMANGFPVLREIMPDQDWHALIRDFFARHRSRTPYFPKLSREFLRYLEQERGEQEREEQSQDFPFLFELAHYECAETLVLFDARDIPRTGHDPKGDLSQGVPLLNPVLLLLRYRWPVHRIRPDFLPDEAPEHPTYLLMYRDRQDLSRFFELNAMSARLVELMRDEAGMTGEELMRRITEESGGMDEEQVRRGGLETLEGFRAKEIVLGTAHPSPNQETRMSAKDQA